MAVRKLRIAALRLSFVPVVFIAVFVRPSWSGESGLAFWIELVGYLFLLIGLVIRMWSILYVGGRKSKRLITEGPYSICRNPLYIGTFFLTVGAGLCFENPLMLFVSLVLVVPAHLLVVRMEEAHLESIFEGEFRKYAKEVPRYWPRFRSYVASETLTISTRAVRRIAVDTVAVLLLPEVEDLLELLHDQGVIPVLWHWP